MGANEGTWRSSPLFSPATGRAFLRGPASIALEPQMAETLRGGRFVIVGVLGEGSQGRTFDATDQQTGEAVAIKRFDVRGARAWQAAHPRARGTRGLRPQA